MFEPQSLPDNTIHNATVRRSENGRLQMIMTAPLIEQFSKPDPKTVYRKGVFMRFFDRSNKPTATLRARYAATFENRDIMLVRDSVVIVDFRTGDTVYLQDLTWNAAEHRIYSEKPLRSKNGRRITLGDSFESDDALQSPQIIHQRGTIEWKEE